MATSALQRLRKDHPQMEVSLGYKQSWPGGVAQGWSSWLEFPNERLGAWLGWSGCLEHLV